MALDSSARVMEKRVSKWVIRWGTVEERRALRLARVRSMRMFWVFCQREALV